MPDIEKVKKSLHCCTEDNVDMGCSVCEYRLYEEECTSALAFDALSVIEDQQKEIDRLKAEQQKWIPVSERLPEEHETIFAKLKGTDKWNKFMFEKMSDDVRVVEVFEDGTRRVSHSHTIDGKWENERSSTIRKKSKISHWMPNPELPKEGEH